MKADTWRAILVTALAANAVLGLGYRVYRLSRGGPMGDVIGQAVLGAILALSAIGVALGWWAARWLALAYGLLFGILVMPVWTLAVLIPIRPGAVDYCFAAAYWAILGGIVAAALIV